MRRIYTCTIFWWILVLGIPGIFSGEDHKIHVVIERFPQMLIARDGCRQKNLSQADISLKMSPITEGHHDVDGESPHECEPSDSHVAS